MCALHLSGLLGETPLPTNTVPAPALLSSNLNISLQIVSPLRPQLQSLYFLYNYRRVGKGLSISYVLLPFRLSTVSPCATCTVARPVVGF